MYIDEIDNNQIPRHIAIIMDGNGRWAKARGEERAIGHQEGVKRVREIMETAVKLKMDYLTLYTFSTENWNRPAAEIAALMSLLLTNMEDDELFMKYDARLKVVGDTARLPQEVQDGCARIENRTKDNKGTCLVVALSYSSKWELTEMTRSIAEKVKDGILKVDDINENVLAEHLATAFMPDPELLIRTGGEQRLSNFLLWQCAYSEFYFTPTLWPDFHEDDLCKAIYDYQHRQRRFGKTSEQVEREQ